MEDISELEVDDINRTENKGIYFYTELNIKYILNLLPEKLQKNRAILKLVYIYISCPNEYLSINLFHSHKIKNLHFTYYKLGILIFTVHFRNQEISKYETDKSAII